ncbi:hypothetical protein NCS52_01425600 [Fusarium sp. LHS14.1]|nr:hypothetical protein NCS52_01425600 [Fusarium sp. LHS14.1]
MGVKAAFIGAGGAILSHVLKWTLLASHNAAALGRDASKLRKILTNNNVSEEMLQSQLAIVEDSSRDVTAVSNLLRHEPDIIFTGITSLPNFHWNPLRPISMEDSTIAGDSAAAVVESRRELKASKAISNSPIFVPISSTGHGTQRDQPLLIPLYLWLLSVAQADTGVLERVVREAAMEDNSPLGGYVMLRPPLLTHGRMKGTASLRVGWAWEDDVYRNSNEVERGIELVQGDIKKWEGKYVNISY